ncbi:hypothetical protein EG68_02668 [Paragonimus skrjabini miyazakii]|uniref:G-protein coupled receptors family 1 profile domain-containing protein n=1 Tax=Paragonimus skrjabini miyazakii TaxID=59628 RepID=A0A8S9Z8I3_9TREM|nr:hypothetical protein EG68_02668 [Paragonimus skrjabini miyazakii]
MLRWDTIIVIIMFILLVVFSVVGNTLVMYIILKSRGMRTVTNYFLFNLSAGDLLTIFQILPNVHFALTQNWIFGLTLCKLSQFFTAFNIAISVFTFIGITTDRYAAIMYPLRPRSSPKATIFFILLIWISAFIVGLPGLVAAELFDQKIHA